MRIVKAVFDVSIAGSREGPYEMLEPDAGKLASPVLRGRGGGNIALLPGRHGNDAATLAVISKGARHDRCIRNVPLRRRLQRASPAKDR